MKKQHRKYLLGAIALIVLIVLTFAFANSIAAWLSAVFGGPGAFKLLQKYLAVENEQRIANKQAEDDERHRLARIRADEAEQRIQQARQKHLDSKELDTQMQRVKTQEDANQAIDKSLDDDDEFLRRRGGFVSITVAIIVFIVAFLSIPLARADNASLSAKEKQRVRRILDTSRRYRRLILRMETQHKLELRKQKVKYEARLKKAANDLVACQAKKQIIAKRPTPPTWPFLLAGAAAGALIVGGIWAGTVIGERGKSP